MKIKEEEKEKIKELTIRALKRVNVTYEEFEEQFKKSEPRIKRFLKEKAMMKQHAVTFEFSSDIKEEK